MEVTSHFAFDLFLFIEVASLVTFGNRVNQ